MKIDLTDKELEITRRALAEFAPEVEVRAFGSRVRGTAKRYSDLDLALVANAPIEPRRRAALEMAFAESDLPFRVDLVEWSTLEPSFRAHVAECFVCLQSPPVTSYREDE